MNNKFFCGIDVSKKKLDVVLLIEDKPHYKVFENSNEGVIFLQEWIENKLGKECYVHFCIEATNIYHELVAFTFLENKKFIVSVVNPRRVKSFAKMFVNTKTDKVDAKLLALYCQKFNPNKFTPQSKERRELRDLSRLMDNLIELRIMQKVRLQTFKTEAAARVVCATIKSIDDSIADIQQEINSYYENYEELRTEKELLCSIPSFGERISNVFLTEIYKEDNGLYNSKKLALIAVARKLLVIACSILNSNQKYDESYVSVLKSSNNLVKISA